MLHRLPKEICDLIYKKYIFNTDDLLLAIDKNNIDAIKEIIHLNKKRQWDFDWNKCLIEAVHNGNLEIIEIMINNGAYNLPIAYKLAIDLNYNGLNKNYLAIAEFIYNTMYSEDGDSFNFMEYFSDY